MQHRFFSSDDWFISNAPHTGYGMKLTTNDGENALNGKNHWSRGNGRGILTPLERQKLENGVLDRHARCNIKIKTIKAIEDLSLILSTSLDPFDARPFIGIEFGNILDALDRYIKELILIQYKLHYKMLAKERKTKGIKRKVSSKEVWKIVNKTLREAKNQKS
jgi:hypothetical protein